MFVLSIILSWYTSQYFEQSFFIKDCHYVSSDYIAFELKILSSRPKFKILYSGNCEALHDGSHWIIVVPEKKADSTQILNVSNLVLETGHEIKNEIIDNSDSNEDCVIDQTVTLKIIIPKMVLNNDTLKISYFEKIKHGYSYKQDCLVLNRADIDTLRIDISGLIPPQTSHPSDY